MKTRRIGPALLGVFLLAFTLAVVLVPPPVQAAPYAAMVIDARSGEVLHSHNADTRLHPASLTKMMTLYIVFEAVKNGEITLDTVVTISRNAAAEPPSKLGLRTGQKIKLRYLIRAAAVRSANDAATALGEAIAGSEAAFARRMTRTAKAMGMTRTTFKNAHGLTASGHMSSARDMTLLGRQLFFDFPQYYNLFSRRSTHAGIKTVYNTNRRFLAAYKGADGIKTGYTNAAGFNLVASAERGSKRVIATVFGGRSTVSRNAKVAELLDLGFSRSPTRVAIRKPEPPHYDGNGPNRGKSLRVATAVTRSLRPVPRPSSDDAPTLQVAAAAVIEDDIQHALSEAQTEAPIKAQTDVPGVRPVARDIEVTVASAQPSEAEPEPEVVTRMSTSGGRHWGINIGRYNSRYAAEKVLLKTALAEMTTLEGSLRKVVKSSRGYDANFLGLTRESADLACRRLQARQIACFMIGPAS